MPATAFQKEIFRKSFHLLCLAALPLLFWKPPACSLFFLLALGAYGLSETGAVPFFSRLTATSKRADEEGRPAWGVVSLCAAGMLLPLCLSPKLVALGLVQVFVADTAAAVIGLRWGRRKLPYAPGKSVLGSVAYWITAVAVSQPLVSWPQALILGGVGTLVETLPVKGVDNILIPVAVALTGLLLGIR